MSENTIKYVFGNSSKNYIEISKILLNEITNNKNEYSYIDNSSFLALALVNGIEWANKVLIFETLQRAYIATITGYLRQHSWIKGILSGVDSENYFVFVSSLRGYLESATDLYDALHNIPLTIAENYRKFNSALHGEVSDELIKPGVLEDILIHFQEARKNSEYTAKIYSPKSAKKYMENNHLIDLNLYECYGKLCEVTHPAGDSLDIFLSSNNYKYSFVEDDANKIGELLNEHSKQFTELFMLTDNLCILILKLLNQFKIEQLYSKSVDLIDMSNIKLWEKIKEYL